MTYGLTRRAAFAAIAVSLATVGHARAADTTAHDFSFTAIEGDALPMASFKGKIVLVVNTASRCGFTSQYRGLQALHEAYDARGFAVLGVPSGDFRQELSSSAEVKQFCEMTYGIDFPMTEIEPVTGQSAHPLFAWMADQGKVPSWNFNKFLIGPDGLLIAHFGSTIRPDAPELLAKIEGALAD